MYFVLLVAYALLLTDGVPPPPWDLLGRGLALAGLARMSPAAAIVLTLTLIAITVATAAWVRRRALQAADGTWEGDAELEDRYSRGGFALLVVVTVLSCAMLLGTAFLPYLRFELRLARFPLVPETLAILPTVLSAVAAWMVLFPVDRAVRAIALSYHARHGTPDTRPWTMREYLMYRVRHQLLTVIVPMSAVVLVKFAVDAYRRQIISATRVPWLPESLVGIGAALVLVVSPVMLAFLWDTRPMPPGPLRSRLEELGRRIGLRYREILVWRSQSLVVNAAVMGLFPRVRYVLFSDGMLETLTPRQVEAVFGHEAGHVRRWHLWYFGAFAVLSMLLVGGVLELLVRFTRMNPAVLQLIALGGMVLIWGLCFGFVSRKFERQADLYGALCLSGDAASDTDPASAVRFRPRGAASLAPPAVGGTTLLSGTRAAAHGPPGLESTRLEAGAAQAFGETLIDVAHLNGIPVDAKSWRHGSVQSRCDLLASFARDSTAAAAFEREVELIKRIMLVLTAVGSGIAAWLYWPF